MRHRLTAVILILLFISTLPPARAAKTMRDDAELLRYIYELSADYGVSGHLVCAVIDCESSWRPDAENHDGTCVGLMQINEINLPMLEDELGITDLYEPYQNVAAGVYMLADLIERCADLDLALMSYNCGESRAGELRAGGIQSTAYSRSVKSRALDYEALYVEPSEAARSGRSIPLIAEETLAGIVGVEYKICLE